MLHLLTFRNASFGVACLLMLPTLHAQPQPSAPTTRNAPASQASVPPEIAKALQLPEGKERNDALGAAIKTWAQQDPTAGLEWMLTLSPRLLGQARMSAGAFGQGVDPRRSADLLVERGTPGAVDLLHGVTLTWTMKDSAAAAAWCEQLQSQNAKARSMAFFTVADGLCRKKPALATAWVAKLPPGDDRLAAVDGTALIWARGDIVAANAWIKTLDAPDLKKAAQTVVSLWKSAKGTKASPNPWPTVDAWLDQLPLTAADKDYVLKNPRR